MLTGLTLTPSAAMVGDSISGVVSLSVPAPSGGSVVALSSSVAGTSVPATVKVAAGKSSGTFKFTTGTVTTATAGVVTASFEGVSKIAALSVYPPSKLVGISVNPVTVIGGKTSKGTVTLAAPVPVGKQVITLTTGSSVLSCPATVTILAGSASGTFTIKSVPVSTNTTATVSATLNGSKLTETLTVTVPQVLSIALSPTSVKGGLSSLVTVKLSGPAGPAGATVQLSTTSSLVSFPATVTVAAGATSATFTATTTATAKKAAADVIAAYGGVTKKATLTILP